VKLVLAMALCANPWVARAQKRVEAGVFLDYLGVSQTQTNNFGVGGRFGYRVRGGVWAEGELAYDYGVNFQEVYNDVANGNVAAIQQTSIGVTQGLFGAKVEPVRGHFRPDGYLSDSRYPNMLWFQKGGIAEHLTRDL
jgi:hypothetical protein